ncbi:tetratricopeptide repeat protein [Sulfurimonas sp.]|uniref:tetratricopeptide repeat protein n=1 Tax=Sulfurimonas sp. TaxID=2022749 RepID=UPI0025FA4A4A|nr:tetratricopeptide repeat protein [Sulfurimonas sp.]MDD5157427.1 tetratricopeptide repeat protein [Sulfurimonas sp.]
MTIFQIVLLAISAYFAYRIYEHVQGLQDPEVKSDTLSSSFDAHSLVEQADEAFGANDMKKAIELLSEAATKKPDDSEILFKTGYILQKQNNNTEALKYYKEALSLDKNNEFIHNSIASVYRANGEFVSAKIHLDDSLALDDKNKITYYNYGNLLVDMQKIDGAKEMYKKALEIDPDFREASAELVKLT